MIVLIDGIRYKYSMPENEDILEKRIIENYQHIFGEDSFCFPKKKMKSKAGIGTIPDAFLIMFDGTPKWCILEVELASHDVYGHVFPQLTKFRRAIESSSSRKKITEFFYETIKADAVLEAQFRRQIGSGEIYKSISDMVNEKPLMVIAIDEKTKKLEEVLLDFGGDVKVIEFKTYCREGSSEINAYMFEPIVTSKRSTKIISGPEVNIKQKIGKRKKTVTIMHSMFDLFDEKGIDNVSYGECEALAKSIKPDTKFGKTHHSWYKNKYRERQAGGLAEGLEIFNTYKGVKFTAQIIEGRKIKFNGEIYNSPSRAAVAAIQSTGSPRKTEDGWRWWRFIDSETGEEELIDELRKT